MYGTPTIVNQSYIHICKNIGDINAPQRKLKKNRIKVDIL